MSVDPVGTLLLDQCVATVVELGAVAAKVLNQCELSTWVLPLVAVSVEDEVVEDDELFSTLNGYIDLLCRVLLLLLLVLSSALLGRGELHLICLSRCQILTLCLLPVKVLADEDQVEEEEEAEDAKGNILLLLEVGKAVGEGAAENNHIAEEEDEVAGPAMDLADYGSSFLFRPLLVTVVETHVRRCQESCEDGNDCRNDADGSKD